MPGSLLNLDRKVTRHDSTRSDISTYSNDSKKKVSFNKAVRVKKYTKSEDGDKNSDGKKFWFKVYKDIDPDIWEEYSGNDVKYYTDNRLKPIHESSVVNDVEGHTKRNNVQHIINKFNERSVDREDGASGNDTLTRYKGNSILNGVKVFFNSASLRNKKKNDSVKERNLKNLFQNESYDYMPSDHHQRSSSKIEKIPEECAPDKYEGNLRNNSERKSNSTVEIKKWDSGNQLIFDTRQYDKSVDKTDEGELIKTVEERDQVWKNVTRSITYAGSSPKIIKKVKENNKLPNERNYDYKKRESYALNAPLRDRSVQCNNTVNTESITRNSDKYKVIRSKDGFVSAYSNSPLLDKDKSKVKRTRSSLNINSICRPSVCSRDHDKYPYRNAENKVKRESNIAQKLKQEDKFKKDSSRESSPCYKSETSDYRRGYSALRNSRRGSRNRTRSRDDPDNLKVTMSREYIEDKNPRGGLVTAYNNRQRARNLSSSPIRSGSGSDTESTHQHKTVVLYIPGISHQQRKFTDDNESEITVKRSQSIKGGQSTKYRYYGLKPKERNEFDPLDELPNNRRFN